MKLNFWKKIILNDLKKKFATLQKSFKEKILRLYQNLMIFEFSNILIFYWKYHFIFAIKINPPVLY